MYVCVKVCMCVGTLGTAGFSPGSLTSGTIRKIHFRVYTWLS